MADATGVFIKECLTAMLSRTRSNAPVSDAGGAFARETAAAVNAAESAAHSEGRAAKKMKTSRSGSGIATANGTSTNKATPADKNSNSKKRKSTDENTTPTALPASTTTPWPLLTPTNPIPSIATGRHKQQLHAQSIAAAKNALKRNEAGLLPCEVESLRRENDGRGRKGDLRLAWELGEHWMGGLGPWLGERLISGVPLGEWDGGEDEDDEDDDASLDDNDVLITATATAAAPNGVEATPRRSGVPLANGHPTTPLKDTSPTSTKPTPNGILKPPTPQQQQQPGKQPQNLAPGTKRKRPPSVDNSSPPKPGTADARPAKRVSLPNGVSAPAPPPQTGQGQGQAQNGVPLPVSGNAVEMGRDPGAWGWSGAGEGDRMELDGLLDSCLSAG